MPNLQQIFEIPTSACLHAFLLSSLKTAFLGGLEVRGLGRQVAFLVCGNLLYVGYPSSWMLWEVQGCF